jgi:hypothetical protein
MIKFKLITHRKTYEIIADNYFIIMENKYEPSELVDSIIFESNGNCIEQIPIVDFYELYEYNNEWILINKYNINE